MKVLQFTHAGSGQEVMVIAEQVYGFYWSDTSKATLLISTGTAVVPVRESVEQVTVKLSGQDARPLEVNEQPIK